MKLLKIICLVSLLIRPVFAEEKAEALPSEQQINKGGDLKITILEGGGGRPIEPTSPAPFIRPTLQQMKEQGLLEEPEIQYTDNEAQYLDIDSCQEDIKENEQISNSSVKNDEVVSDMLFARKGSIPEDWPILIGKHVMLFELDGARTKFETMYALAHRIPCVPYRIRITNKEVSYLSGKYALKNYEDRKGGKLHELLTKQ